MNYLKNPEQYIYEFTPPQYHQFIKNDEYGLYWDSGTSINSLEDLYFEKKILEHSSIVSHYDADIIEVIKENQREGVLFLVGLDYYTLNNEPKNDTLP